LCLQAIELAEEAARKGNVNSASDAGVAALMGRAGVEGAALNVLINLGSVNDEAFKKDCRDTVDSLVADASRRCDEVVAHVKGTFSKGQ
jgi:formiminotetrahydrofolate cyclodeaminase